VSLLLTANNDKKVSRRKFLKVGAGVVAVGVIGAAAYSLMQQGSPTPAVNSTSVPASTSMASLTSSQMAQLAQLTELSTEEYESLDPQFSGGTGADFSLAINMYDRLFRPKIINGQEQPSPDLVTNYNVTPDGLTWTMNLQQGVKFHDGTELSADDVAWSFDRYLNFGKGFSYLYNGFIDPGNTTALDKYTVQFKFKLPYSPFPASLCRFYVLNKALVSQNITGNDYGHGWLDSGNEAGSGPYTLTSVQPREEVVLSQFPGYWKGWQPGNRVTQFHWKPIIEIATMKTLLISGQGDMDDGWMGADAYKSLVGQPNIVIERNPWIQSRVLSMNNQRMPFDDIHVRKAVSWAMDYNTYNSTLEYNARQGQGPVPIGLFGHDDSLFQYTQDYSKAKAELAQSKYSASELAAPIMVPSFNDNIKAVFLLAQQSFAPIGINLQLQDTTYTKMIASITSGDPQQAPAMLWWGNTVKYPSPDSYLGAFASSTWGTWQGQAWYKNKSYDDLLTQSRAETDQTKLLTEYSGLQKMVVDDAVMVWLSNPYSNVSIHNWVQGFTWLSCLGEFLYLPNFTITPH